MNSLNKVLLLFVVVFMFVPTAYSQNNADPGIGILMTPASLEPESDGILRATVGNYGNQTIVVNSLRVTISVGANAEIIGIAPGSDARWSQLTLTAGPANTIRLTNIGGAFSSFDVGDILLDVKGKVESGPVGILANIVYITASNPLLCPEAVNCPLNASQGNARNAVNPQESNDNSQTSLAVTTDEVAIFIKGTVFYDYNRLFDNEVNGLGIIPVGTNALLVQVNASAPDEVVAVIELPATGQANVGQYQFDAFSGRTYYVMLTTETPAPGDSPPPTTSTLVAGYTSTGENIGLTGSDGIVDGKLSQFTTTSVNTEEANFGIIRFESITVD
ncbi:MAG: hypothetical protein ACI8XV_002566 [Arenicella sp.]|jgi:hypothetical protein